MKKKIILIIILSIIGLGVIFGTVDYIRFKNDKNPIFTIYVHGKSNWDKYYGLGYLIVKNDDCEDVFVKFGSYLSTYACFLGPDYPTNIKIIKSENCNAKADLYFTEENRKVYTYCIDEINIYKGKDVLSLKEYLGLDEDGIEFIIENFAEDSNNSYDDGGSILYHGDNFNILKCHTIMGNNDIYIGDKNMGYSSNFCN